MEKKEIEQLIRKYLRDNLVQHPRAFPDTFSEVNQLSKILADGYWEHRDRKEVNRDRSVGITVQDYRQWCNDELTRLKKVTLYN